MEAGRMEWRMADVDPKAVIEDALAVTGGLFAETSVVLELNLESRLPPVHADRDRLIQVIVNLLSNAVKFTPEGGKIEIRVSRSENGDLSISVADTGIGISEEDFDRVLSPFGQVESAYSGTYEGTGLGLPITKALIELHGGTLTLESTVGVGTTIALSFPKERVLEPDG
jgi:signal transduction histidine kinase